MDIKRLPIEKIELNTGQIEGLPANPRQWTRDDIDRIAASLKETPELFEMRPCIVYPNGDKYVLLAGNLRFTGARQNGDKDVPCVVCPKEMPVEKLREIVIKDNGSFGAWDFDALANEWDSLPLTDWGVPAWGFNEKQDTSFKGDNLPTELQGMDLSPDELAELQGDDETPMERIIICFKPDEKDALAALLGLEVIDKVLYRYDELSFNRNGE